MNFIKKLSIALLLLIILASTTIWVLTKTLKPDTVNHIINDQLTALTSQKSQIKGEIVWHLFPQPGLKATQIYVGDEKNNTGSFLRIENLYINLKITPLLQGKLTFNELEIDGVKIYITPTKTNSSPTLDKQIPSHRIVRHLPAEFALERLLLTHGQLVIDCPPNKIIFRDLQIGAEQLNAQGEFFPIQMKGKGVLYAPNGNTRGTINYQGRTRLVPAMFTQPMSALDQAVTEGQLLIQNLRYKQLNIAKIDTNLVMSNNTLVLNPLNISFLAGESIGNLKYFFTSKNLVLNQTATGLDASQFFMMFSPQNLINGALDFSLHAKANFQTSSWQSSLSGTGALTIKEGVIYGIDLNKLIDDTTVKIHLLMNQPIKKNALPLPLQMSNPSAYQEGNTPFELLSLQYQLSNSQLHMQPVLLQTARLQLKGTGAINLPDNRLSSNATAKIITTDVLINKVQSLLGGGFPVRVAGTLQKLQILPDTKIINPILSKYVIANSLTKPLKIITTPVGMLLEDVE